MIENRFKKWLTSEIDCAYTFEDLVRALSDEDDAMDLWEDFETWHREDFLELVRMQIKSILKDRSS